VVRAQLAAAALVALACCVLGATVLADSDVRLAETNGVLNDAFLVDLRPGQEACQVNVLTPGDAVGARIFVGTHRRPGPPLTLLLRDGSGRVVRRGRLSRGYDDATWQIVPFEPVRRVGRDYALCFRSSGRVALAGSPDGNIDGFSELRLDGNRQTGDLAYQLVQDGPESLFEFVPSIFRRASLFRPDWIGPWTYYVAALLLLLIGALAVGALIAATTGRLSRRAQLASVAAVALLNAFVWSIVMPSFQPPDEAAHYAYVASLVELDRRPYTDPAGPGGSYSAEENLAIGYVAMGIVQFPERRPPWTGFEEEEWRAQDKTIEDRQPEFVGGGWTTVAAYSPAYYALEAPIYAIADDSSVFTRLWLMRLLSVLMAAGTAVIAFFVGKELLPDVTWAPVASGAAVAFQPMFAQIGGAVNNDILLILLASLELYLLVRILRRGLTVLSGLAVGVVLGLGIMAKPNMYAFVPVVAFALGWLLVRERQRWRSLVKPVALAVAAASLVTAGSYWAFHQSELVAGTATPTGGSEGSLRALLSYLWQWYVPALPFMRDYWPSAGDISVPAWDIYFRGFWADFAHLDTAFPDWVYAVLALVSLGAVPAIVLAVVRERERRSVLVGQVLVLASAVAATALLVTYRSYLALIQSNVQPFAQGRYLLQTVVVVGAAVALAAKGLGARWGPVTAVALVTALFGLNVFSLGLVLTRFYT
jgi:4-amino-4-deoxy-L-arabinose transferase-like glycosyltransferase